MILAAYWIYNQRLGEEMKSIRCACCLYRERHSIVVKHIHTFLIFNDRNEQLSFYFLLSCLLSSGGRLEYCLCVIGAAGDRNCTSSHYKRTIKKRNWETMNEKETLNKHTRGYIHILVNIRIKEENRWRLSNDNWPEPVIYVWYTCGKVK